MKQFLVNVGVDLAFVVTQKTWGALAVFLVAFTLGLAL